MSNRIKYLMSVADRLRDLPVAESRLYQQACEAAEKGDEAALEVIVDRMLESTPSPVFVRATPTESIETHLQHLHQRDKRSAGARKHRNNRNRGAVRKRL